MDNITFNGIDFSDFNTFWDGSKLFASPQKDMTFYEIPGRNGDLAIDNDRYANVEVSVKCFIRERFIDNYNALINFLLTQKGYKRFENDIEPEIYRMAAFVSSVVPETGPYNEFGTFELKFNVKPQRWLKSGELPIAVNSSTVLINPTSLIAKPLIMVTGTGSIDINGNTLTLANNTSVTCIDCDTENAYEGTINRNQDLTLTNNSFPVLETGQNTITVSGCTIELIPRWWKL